jgi:prevent-host-death family protein
MYILADHRWGLDAMARDSSGVSALDARTHFSDLLGRARHGKEPVIIRRHNRPVAALVPSRI